MNEGAYGEDRSTTARLAGRLRESAGKEGGDVWRRFVVEELTEAWAPQAAVTAEQLHPWWKGFPRGRIERAGIRAYTVFHADDFTATGLTPARIEAAFELGNSRVTWSLDPHEEQNAEHRAALQRLLGL